MITPRQTRLFRAEDLHEFQRIIRHLAAHEDPSILRGCGVIVPTAAAADQLRRTLEDQPLILTRLEWYDIMHSRLLAPPPRLNDLEREVLLNGAARDATASGTGAPFRLRAGLLVEMLAFYDDLRRRGSSVDHFERLLKHDLERDAEADRGADRLLRQTRFLAETFRRYEERRDAIGAVDEHTLRSYLLEAAPVDPLRHVIVTVGDRSIDPFGLWPADFDLLTRLPDLERIDIVATRPVIAAGFLDRIQKFMPGFEESELSDDLRRSHKRMKPTLIVPETDRAFFVSRDREDELSSIATLLAARAESDLEALAIVFKQQLPYVYVARQVFADAGIPFQSFDSVPLAAEPYAAALDLVFDFVMSNFTREPVVALLTSPHFLFHVDGKPLWQSDITALNRMLSEEGYFGGIDRLKYFAKRSAAAQAAANAADELGALATVERPSVQLTALASYLEAHDRAPAATDHLRERHLRARSAILSAIHGLLSAHRRLDDSPVDFRQLASMIRRWIEGQTFTPRTGTNGIQLLDVQAARYGEFEEVFLVGLVEGEWPERRTKNIFYPSSLLGQLDWADSRAALAGERASFEDLLLLANRQVQLSAFELENDSIVGPSVFLEGINRFELQTVIRQPAPGELSRGDPGEAVTAWLRLRMERSNADGRQFHGTARPYRPSAHSVSSLERYLQCPFRFFSEYVLKLEEDPEDEATLNPRELGIFVHDVFRSFFQEWTRAGRRAITPDNLPEARRLFTEILEPLLGALSPAEAAVQRTRLLGSAADEGLAEAVFQLEAEWETPVIDRLLEYGLNGEFEICGDQGSRRVTLRGKADRIDLLQDGTFRVIDYKLSRAPERKLALQLPDLHHLCSPAAS